MLSKGRLVLPVWHAGRANKRGPHHTGETKPQITLSYFTETTMTFCHLSATAFNRVVSELYPTTNGGNNLSRTWMAMASNQVPAFGLEQGVPGSLRYRDLRIRYTEGIHYIVMKVLIVFRYPNTTASMPVVQGFITTHCICHKLSKNWIAVASYQVSCQSLTNWLVS